MCCIVGAWCGEWHCRVCPQHPAHRDQQCHRQPCILNSTLLSVAFAYISNQQAIGNLNGHSHSYNYGLHEQLTDARFMVHDLPWPHQSQMVFADKKEIISGGNFHGEYPAKVCTQTLVHLMIQSDTDICIKQAARIHICTILLPCLPTHFFIIPSQNHFTSCVFVNLFYCYDPE